MLVLKSSMTTNTNDLPSKKIKDMRGARVGRLAVEAFSGFGPSNAALWQCRCDCGNLTTLRTGELTRSSRDSNGRVRIPVLSCGCLKPYVAAAIHTKHGMAGSAEFNAWSDMKSRCSRENHPEFKRYGARGIAVCDRWLRSFEAFLADMGMRPEGLSLERIDVNGNYEPGNCRWATKKEQQRNRRDTRRVTFLGREMSLAEACELSGVDKSTVRGRLRRGWPIVRVFARTE